MKVAIKYISLALLVCLLTVASESVCHSGTAAIGGHLVGRWSGMYQEHGGGCNDFKASIPQQTENRFSGTFQESPVGQESFTGTVDEGGKVIITCPAGLELDGMLDGDSFMSGYYKTSDGHTGYWELDRNK